MKKKAYLRARDRGDVVQLSVEIGTPLNRILEECRSARQWSRRTLVENALRQYLAEQGFPVNGRSETPRG